MESNIKESVCDFTNLFDAMNKCKKGVTWKDSVSRYTNNGLASIYKLQNMLIDDKYEIDKYYQFTIYEPKKREIVSTKFKDRVFQRSLCDNYLYDEITKRFIYDNGACQINKGTDFCRDRLKTHLHKYYRHNGYNGYVLKCDFKNYFASTPHATVKRALNEIIKDEWVLDKVFQIIDSYDTGNKTGLGLGSQITQLVQLLVLNHLDHFVKEALHIKHYIRYMDDMVLIFKDKKYLKYCLSKIKENIVELGLTLNSKKTQIFKLEQGLEFLGFKFSLTKTGKVLCIINKKNTKKRKRKLKKHMKLVKENKMTIEKSDQCFESWKAHVNKGNSYNVINGMNKYYNDLRSNYV